MQTNLENFTIPKLDVGIIEAIRHDFHKLKGTKHDSDKKLSTKADGDASRMSRVVKKGKTEYPDDVNNYRLSLVDGNTFYKNGNNERESICSRIRRDYYNKDNAAEVMYNKLLRCDILSKFNEDPILPCTSLKYHTLLTTNLHWNYLNGRKYEDLYFNIMNLKDVECIYSVVFLDEYNKKCFTICDKGFQSSEAISHIGKTPTTNFAEVMSRIAGEVYLDKYLYSNLKRVHSWSTGLQYLEDVGHLYKEGA